MVSRFGTSQASKENKVFQHSIVGTWNSIQRMFILTHSQRVLPHRGHAITTALKIATFSVVRTLP